MKKVFVQIFITAIISILFSCSNGSGLESDSPVKVSLDVVFSGQDTETRQKTISVTNGSDHISRYTYVATPLWQSAEHGTICGTQTEPADFTNGMSLICAQGMWRIVILGFCSGSDTPVYRGETSCAINAKVGSISVPMEKISGTGIIDIAMDVPQISSGGGILTVLYSKNGESEYSFSGFSRTVSDGIITFSAQLELPAGFYTFRFIFSDGNLHYQHGETVVAESCSGYTNRVRGTFSFGNLIALGAETAVSGTQAFLCTSVSDTGQYIWYVDGRKIKDSSSRSFAYIPAGAGSYTVVCRASEGGSYTDDDFEFDLVEDVVQVFPEAQEGNITLGAVITPSENITVHSYSWITYIENQFTWNPAVGIWENVELYNINNYNPPWQTNIRKIWSDTSRTYISVEQNVIALNGKNFGKVTVTLPSPVTLEAGKTYTIFTRKNRYSKQGGDAENVYVIPSKTQVSYIYHSWAYPGTDNSPPHIQDGPAVMPAVYLEINGAVYNGPYAR